MKVAAIFKASTSALSVTVYVLTICLFFHFARHKLCRLFVSLCSLLYFMVRRRGWNVRTNLGYVRARSIMSRQSSGQLWIVKISPDYTGEHSRSKVRCFVHLKLLLPRQGHFCQVTLHVHKQQLEVSLMLWTNSSKQWKINLACLLTSNFDSMVMK